MSAMPPSGGETSLFVGDLPFDANDSTLLAVFGARYPTVVSAKVRAVIYCFEGLFSPAARVSWLDSPTLHLSVGVGCVIFVLCAQVMTDPATGMSKGYGFVRFSTQSDRDR
jgi:RNA recognition motif-containing protein